MTESELSDAYQSMFVDNDKRISWTIAEDSYAEVIVFINDNNTNKCIALTYKDLWKILGKVKGCVKNFEQGKLMH